MPSQMSVNSSQELGEGRHDTDKDEGYLKYYREFFQPFRDKPVRLLELGVWNGGSLELWRDYFINGTITGIDIEPKARIADMARISIYEASQDDLRALDGIAGREAPGGFDIIIDDAAHVGHLAKRSFWHLFRHHLKPGGLYAIEDWGTGYWPSWPDGREAVPPDEDDAMQLSSHQAGMVGFVKQLVDECGIADLCNADMAGYSGPPRRPRFERVVVVPGIVFIRKSQSE